MSYDGLYTARYDEVLCLCRLLLANHHDAEEVAQMLGISRGSVKRYLFRAVQHLRSVLGERR